MSDEVFIKRNPKAREVCILVSGARRGMFLPLEVVEWLQDNDVAWTVRGDNEMIAFTIFNDVDRTLFAIRFAHLR